MKIHHRVLVKDLLLTLTLKEIHIILHMDITQVQATFQIQIH
nr:MAG TPA: hypothetical protein [Caudoviricetes sp.]DAL22027.1 MAG TPA_asm: hypothetical protein [Caudoviricetes sp.]